MPDENTQTTSKPVVPSSPVSVSDASAADDLEPTVDSSLSDVVVPAAMPDLSTTDSSAQDAPAEAGDPSEIVSEVANKIIESHNILIALSSDPSVDEMACAIGLSLCLDKMGKRATAIYSGSTPNALEFLKPEETFEDTADTLQDFVIALNKDKADHLRYKLDGDFVKIYITPYKTRISEDDLEFSYGDFNVDLVLALDVANGIDLDTALREHGRIMHDAVIVNITTGKPGKLGEIEWSDKNASSVSEMIARLLYGIGSKASIEKEEATAFLTGIVAATNRFSSASTTSETMKTASRLMESGANQQLISKNITPDVENELFFNTSGITEKSDNDPTKLDIEHGNKEVVDEDKVVDAAVTEKESTLLDDLKAAEASLANAGAETTPEDSHAPIRLDDKEEETTSTESAATEPTTESTAEVADVDAPSTELPAPDIPTSTISPNPSEKVIAPSEGFDPESLAEGTNKYGQMLEDAIAEDGGLSATPTIPIVTAPEIPVTPIAPSAPVMSAPPTSNPATSFAPAVPSAPEINGVPDINYMPLPGDEVLPPPPAPPVDFSAPMPETPPDYLSAPTVPEPTPEPTPTPTPAAPIEAPLSTPSDNQPVSSPDAFKIPGM